MDDPPDPANAHATSSGLNRDRLAEWFFKWRKPIRNWLKKQGLVHPSDADDAAQEVFLRVLRYSDDAMVQYPQSYLFRVALNVANEWRERIRNIAPHEDTWLEDLRIEDHDEPENIMARALANKYIQANLEQLPKRQREVLLLHMHEGLTYKQISRKQDLTLRVVRRDIARAYAELRAQIDREIL